jgi:16S rRNA (guanine527-N7)-methyltransferase
MREFSNTLFELINGEFSGINLTSINDPDEFYHKQIIDSIAPIGAAKVFNERIHKCGLIVDVGFGGGFPLLPLAYKLPKIKVIGLEARNKKVQVVTQLAERLNLSNVQVFHHRLEDILFDKECVITFKAVGKVEEFVEKINNTKKVTSYFYKGPNFHELENIGNLNKSWKVVEDINIPVEQTMGRLFIGLEGRNVPRGTSKNLVKLSSLI